MNLIEALKFGVKIKRRDWGDFIDPNCCTYILSDILQDDWVVEVHTPKKIKRWKVYFKNPSGGLEIIWLTEEEVFKIPGDSGFKNHVITEEFAEFPL